MVTNGLYEQADAELATDTSQLLATMEHDRSTRCGWKRGIRTVGTLIILGSGVVATVIGIQRPRSQTLSMRPSELIHKADADLRGLLTTNIKKFRQTMESSEIAESLKIDEGHNVNPIRSADAIGFTESEVLGLHEAFDEWDTDRDGYISRTEMKDKMESQLHMKGVKDEDIMRMIQEGDAHGNRDGRISFNEFASLMQRAHEQSVDVEKAVFQFFDTNKDHQVEVFEAWRRQKEIQHGGDSDDQMKKSDVGQVIQSVDMSHDGRDSMNEWELMAE